MHSLIAQMLKHTVFGRSVKACTVHVQCTLISKPGTLHQTHIHVWCPLKNATLLNDS